MIVTYPFRVQGKRKSRWTTHCKARSLALAQMIAQRLQAEGETVRIVRTIIHR